MNRTCLELRCFQGKLSQDAFFLSSNEVIFACRSFLKICKTDEHNEICVHGPENGIGCMTADVYNNVIAVSDRSKNTNIFIIQYPHFEKLSNLQVDRFSIITGMRFAKDCYLFTIEEGPDYSIDLWNWKTETRIECIRHNLQIDNTVNSIFSINPSAETISCFQQDQMMHFYEIHDVCSRVEVDKRTIFLPLKDDKTGETLLTEDHVKNMKLSDDVGRSWGLHSEVLKNVPWKVLYEKLSDLDIVMFKDDLMRNKRLHALCHCWLPDSYLLIACSNGSILNINVSNLEIRVVYHSEVSEKFDEGSVITALSVNSLGLYAASKGGDIFLIPDDKEWSLTKIVSIKYTPLFTKFSPKFENLLIVSEEGPVLLMEEEETGYDLVCMDLNSDSSAVVGMFFPSENYFIAAKESGLIESFSMKYFVRKASTYIEENITDMDGSPLSAAGLISTTSPYVYVLDASNESALKIVKVLRPSEEPIVQIYVEEYGKFALLLSKNRLLFIISLLPSKDFSILGYLILSYESIDLTVVTQSSSSNAELNILCKNLEKEDEEGEYEVCYLLSLEISEELIENSNNYWIDKSGVLDNEKVGYKEAVLDQKYTRVSSHSKYGVLLYDALENKLVSFKEDENISFNFPYMKVFKDLKLSHQTLLILSDKGEVFLKNLESNEDNFLKSKIPGNFSSFRFSHDKKSLLVGFSDGTIACYDVIGIFTEKNDTPWFAYHTTMKEKETNIISNYGEVRSGNKEQTSWVTSKIHELNDSVMWDLEIERKEHEQEALSIKKELEELISKNILNAEARRIKSDEFILDKEIRSEYLANRDSMIANQKDELKNVMEKIQQDTEKMKTEFLDNMLVEGKSLKPIKEGGRILFNYPIPKLSDDEMVERERSLKLSTIKGYIKQLSSGGKEIVKSTFTEDLEEVANIDEYCSKLEQDIFYLHNHEARVDYISILKYIIHQKRLHFNQLFDTLVRLKIDTIFNMNENNARIREIVTTLDDDSFDVPADFEFDDMGSFRTVSDSENEEVLNRYQIEESGQKKPGLAEEFLKDSWLIANQNPTVKKFRPKPRKDVAVKLKKEREKLLRTSSELLEKYENAHEHLVDEKLKSDFSINRDEFQLFLLIHSLNYDELFRAWEKNKERELKDLSSKIEALKPKLVEMDDFISKSKTEEENIARSMTVMDEEVYKYSRISKNKLNYLAEYDRRPHLEPKENTKNPFVDNSPDEVPKYQFKNLNSVKYKPENVPWNLWRELCRLREIKASQECRLIAQQGETRKFIEEKKRLIAYRNKLKQIADEKSSYLDDLHKMRLRCTYELPSVATVPSNQLETPYPDQLDFQRCLFTKRDHMDVLNALMFNAGEEKLSTLHQMAKAASQIEKNQAKLRIKKVEIDNVRKDKETVERMNVGSDMQMLIEELQKCGLRDRIEAVERICDKERHELQRQVKTVAERVREIEKTRRMLRRSMKERAHEMTVLKGNIAELKDIECRKRAQNSL